jgi:hypothetical protein
MKVYTHINVDLDAVASVWAAREFIPGAREAELVFVPANWDGEGMDDGDLALDIRAGDRGIKGEQRPDGTVGSCFAQLVAEHASSDDQEALARLVAWVDAQDAHGQPVEWLAPEASSDVQETLTENSISGTLRDLQETLPNDDAVIVELMGKIFSGRLKRGHARHRAHAEADRAELIGAGRVAIVRDKREKATNAILFDRGVRVIVYQDGYDIGVVRANGVALKMDHRELLAVIHAAGEEIGDGRGTWFIHSAKFLLAWGTFNAPATSPSAVRPDDLAAAAAQLLDAAAGPCWNCDWPGNGGREYCFHCGAGLRNRQTWGNAEY